MNKRYVTTTIPYVNAAPHVGFALELVQADVIARYERLLGNEVRFQSGTDENAAKNVTSARERGVPVAQFVAENAACFQELCAELDISIDRFLRTTEDAHRRAVHAFLARLRPGDVYETAYRGLYCPGCEDFYLPRELIADACPDHGNVISDVEERNHFFRLSRYQTQLRDLIASRRLHVVPESRETEGLQFIDCGLDDISISRDAARSDGWGIRFPDDPGQIVYVWIDALINYLTGLGYPGDEFSSFWNEDSVKLHVIGRNVWKFHAVYWPALLLSAGLSLPNRIVSHGFLTIDGEKISKSRGRAPAPGEYIRQLGPDALRYYLLRYTRPFHDSDFSAARLHQVYETDLANGLGNLCSRLTTLCEAVELTGVPQNEPAAAPPDYHEPLRVFQFDRALSALWKEVGRLNREIVEVKPWIDVRAGRHAAVRETLAGWVARLHTLAYWLSPFLPGTGRALRDALAGPAIRKCGPLFPRKRRDGLIRREASC
jgi:methionyl-tRNA synthetase